MNYPIRTISGLGDTREPLSFKRDTPEDQEAALRAWAAANGYVAAAEQPSRAVWFGIGALVGGFLVFGVASAAGELYGYALARAER